MIKRSFYFIRHGETDWNLNGIYQGWNDIPLNNTGVKQAEDLSKKISFDVEVKIFSSPLKRAIQTAKIIADDLGGKEIFEISDLKECRHEQSARYVLTKKGITKMPSFSEVQKDFETYEDFKNRILLGLQKVLDHVSEAQIPVIIAHGGVFVAICDILSLEPVRTPNCSLFHFESGLLGYKCTKLS